MYKSFIIHLSKIQSSLDSALILKSQLENFKMPVELFEGSYGNEIKEQFLKEGKRYHPWGFKGGPSEPFSDEYRDREEHKKPGEIGCFSSHYRLWQKCVELDEPIFIWEDDARVMRKYQPVEWVDVLSVASSHEKKMRKYWQYLLTPEGEPVAADYFQSSMPGNAGYLIKPHAAKILVNEYKNSFLPADNAINQHLIRIQIHSHMMGKAEDRNPTAGKSSLIRTRFWDKNERNI